MDVDDEDSVSFAGAKHCFCKPFTTVEQGAQTTMPLFGEWEIELKSWSGETPAKMVIFTDFEVRGSSCLRSNVPYEVKYDSDELTAADKALLRRSWHFLD